MKALGPSLLMLLAGCAGASPVATPHAPVVYPPAPEAPRVVLLASYSGSQDLVTRSDFERFVVGESDQRQEILQPGGVTLQAGRLLVTDSEAGVVHVLDVRQGRYEQMRGDGEGILSAPESIATSPLGRLFVGDRGRGVVAVFRSNHAFDYLVGQADVDVHAGASEQEEPAGKRTDWGGERPALRFSVATSPSHVFVAKPWDHTVDVYDAEGAAQEWTFGWSEPAPEAFFPAGVACDASGAVLVSDLLSGRIRRFSPRGKLLQTFGRLGDGPGEFRRPRGLACDAVGRVYVADEGQDVVQVFDAEGALLFFFGGPTATWEGLLGPVDVAIDTEHVDLFAKRIPKGFAVEHLVLVTSQTAGSKVSVFGFLREAKEGK